MVKICQTTNIAEKLQQIFFWSVSWFNKQEGADEIVRCQSEKNFST